MLCITHSCSLGNVLHGRRNPGKSCMPLREPRGIAAWGLCIQRVLGGFCCALLPTMLALHMRVSVCIFFADNMHVCMQCLQLQANCKACGCTVYLVTQS